MKISVPELFDPVIFEDAQRQLEVFAEEAEPTDVLITGASGLVGGYLSEFYASLIALQSEKFRLTMVVRRATDTVARIAATNPRKIKVLFESELVEHLGSISAPLHVIHAASPAAVKDYAKNSKGLISTNVASMLKICDGLERNPKSHVTYLSSGEVYGQSPLIPTPENSFSPINHLLPEFSYAEAKRAGEYILKSYCESDSINGSALRIYHGFGPGIAPTDERIFASVINSLVNGSDIVLRTDGSATRGFIYLSDLASAIRIAKAEKGFIALNVGGLKEISILEFANLGASLSGGRSNVVLPKEILPDTKSNAHSQRGFADTTLLQSLGWQQQIDIKEGIARSIASGRWRQELSK